jgi:hypothetical protein
VAQKPVTQVGACILERHVRNSEHHVCAFFDRPLPAVLARGRDGGSVIFDYAKLG